jgi:hypothetical protein
LAELASGGGGVLTGEEKIEQKVLILTICAI